MQSSSQQSSPPTQNLNSALELDEASKIIEELQDQLLIYITSILGNTRDCDDVLQETNIYLINELHQFQAGSNFRAWAYKIAYFKALACRRDNLRRKEVVFSEGFMNELSSKAEDFSIKQAERLAALSNCLEKLPPKDKLLIEKKYISRVSLTQHASEVGKSANSFHKQISRLRLILRKCVEKTLTTS